MSENIPVYSIQRTYIIKSAYKSEKHILTCDERIDIPTIEPLPSVKPVLYDGQSLTVIPCIELAGEFFSEIDLTFETNEGVTILPERINTGTTEPLKNPYTHVRYVLALPRGATGVRTCKLIHRATGKEVQHNLTFGVMPPPYNYDNALFGYCTGAMSQLYENLDQAFKYIGVSNTSPDIGPAYLPKGEGAQTIQILPEDLFFYATFIYPLSSEPTIHKPVISLIADEDVFDYTLSLNKTKNTVLIDLFTGMITAYDSDNGEIIQQFMIDKRYNAFKTLAFVNFDDIDDTYLTVIPRGALLNV